MKLSAWIYTYVFDPLIIRIENRISHLQSLRPIACHDGSKWRGQAQIGKECKFYPDARLINHGFIEQVSVGNSCHVRGELLNFPTGKISIGPHSFIGSDSKIWCHQKISIGAHVLIAHRVEIHDSNYHSLDLGVRRTEIHQRFDEQQKMPETHARCQPVVICDDVWIGFGSSLFKGVTVGQGAVVAACSVVTKDVQPFTLVAGNPARKVRELEQ
jgi:maltose O-acetyltransferase